MKTRYEIQTRLRTDGLITLTIYDDYWDTVSTAILDKGFGNPSLLATAGIHNIFDSLTHQLANLQPGMWYALRTADYPFGAPTEIARIPGRNRVYAKAEPARKDSNRKG